MRACPAPMMSGGFPCICNFKQNKQTRGGGENGEGRGRRGGKGDTRTQKSRKSPEEEGVTCGAGSAGTCRPGRATAGLGDSGSDSREGAQIPALVPPSPPGPALLPPLPSVAAPARFTRRCLHLPRSGRQRARRGERERSAIN